MLNPVDTLRRRLREERGFAMPVVLITIVIAMVVVGTVLADVQEDFRPGRKDEDRKIAYAAAEAGINDYLARLTSNPSYWSKCTDPGNNPALSNPGTQNYVNVPGGTGQFAIELLPTSGFTACVVGNQASFVNSAGEFKIRSTGRPRAGSTTERSIIATFRPKGFLNYIYFTDYETWHPTLYRYDTRDRQTRLNSDASTDVVEWATAQCATRYWPDRDTPYFDGQISNSGLWTDYDRDCSAISFCCGDKLSGPFHTNDSILLSGSASFGRNPKDIVEVGASPGYRGGTPGVNMPGATTINPNVGTWKVVPRMVFPPSNAGLRDDAQTQHRFKGPTFITLNGQNMTVTGKPEGETVSRTQTLSIPEGVVFVSDDNTAGSCPGFNPIRPYNGSSQGEPAAHPACGDLFIKGSYSQNVTFASSNDIVVTGNITRTTDAWMLGLIPDKFARIYHPVRRLADGQCDILNGGVPTSGTPLNNPQIDAAILALTRSFAVDGHECGPVYGTLTVRGAIAQKYRGTVGTLSGGTAVTGYIKNYQYDDRLAQRSPPRFMNPVQPAWALANQTEQIPAS
jgi:Tfp pilus assembly protein PilX